MKNLVFLINFMLILPNVLGMYSENCVKRDHKRSFSEMSGISDESSKSKKSRDDNCSEMSLDSDENFSRKRSYSEITKALSEDIQSEKGKDTVQEDSSESNKVSCQDIFSIIEKIRQQIRKPSSVNSNKSRQEERDHELEKIKRKKQNSLIEELKNQNLFLKSKIAELTKQIEEVHREKLHARNFKKKDLIRDKNNLSLRSKAMNKQKDQLSDLYAKNRDMLAYCKAYSPLKKLVINEEDLMNMPIEVLEFPKLMEIVILGDLGQNQEARNRLLDLMSKAPRLEVLKFR